jgi:L,D-transpeptidase YcbB
MQGVRLDRFLDRLLASTAVVLLLSAGTAGLRAEPMSDPAVNAAAPAPDAAKVAPAGADADKAAAKPAESTDEAAAPAAAATPQRDISAEQPESPAPAAAAPPATPDATGTAAVSSPGANSPAAAAATPATPETTGTLGTAAVPTPTEANPAATSPTASAPPATTPAASTMSEADAAIAERLHDLSTGKFDHVIGGKKDRTTIDAFYSGRSYAPLWITDGKANARAKSAIAYLGHVDADGLDPADYPMPNFAALSDPAALADAELKLTMAVITYAHHAAVGRVHWSRVSGDISYSETAPEPADVLAAMAEAKDTGAALDAYEPHAAGYLALKAKLAEIRAGKTDPSKPAIASGPAPKIGAQDDRVPQLRDRLGVAGDGSSTYDKDLAEAVKQFQKEHELKQTGTLTPPTIEALNGRQTDRPTDVILANIERWRWMPHDLGNTYVIVNLPDYSLRVMHDGKLVWTTKIVIGKPDKPTPIMSAEMKYITVNPTWNVPPSIVANEYLPALAQDPTVLERMGLRVSHNPDGTIHISQPPGDKNALGRIRFNFPNKFLVYQHDTPDKNLFAYAKRAFSHGCMRVYDPPKYAEVLLSLVRPGDGYTEDRIKKMYGSNETDIQFPTFIPVHLTYQTAFVDDSGKLEFREDVYGRDKALLALLKGAGEERRVADIAVERKENVVRRQILAIPDQPSLWGGRTAYNGASQWDGQGFFSRLFGNPFGAPAPQVSAHRRPAAQRRTELR